MSDYQGGRLLSTMARDSGGSQVGATTNGYDAHGRLAWVTDARTGTTTNSYDAADRLTSVATPAPAAGQASQVTTISYNNLNWVTGMTLPDGGSVASIYHLTGELATNSGARTYPTAYSYDYAGRRKTLTTWTNFAGASGAAVTTWNYDPYRGFLTNKAYADGLGPRYAYTNSGQLITRIWARGVTSTYGYNSVGDLATIAYSDGTPNVTNSYDRLGRLKAVNQGTNTTVLVYNDAGQLLSETFNGLVVTNTYDHLLRRTNLGLNTPSSTVNCGYAYDAASRLASVAFGTNSVAYGYLTNSPLVESITFQNGATTRLTTMKKFDKLNRLLSISNGPSAGSAMSFAYAYNTANQRTAVTNADSSRWAWQYDTLGQVTSGNKYWNDGSVVAGQQFEYSFDDIGNRRSASSGGDQFGANLRYQNYTANNLNQHANRTVPGSFDVLGTATNTATVTVVAGSAGVSPAAQWAAPGTFSTSRKSEYFRGEVWVNNTTGAVYAAVTNIAVLPQGANGDIVTNIAGSVFVPKTSEAFAYDADGNLTNDGRWSCRWDADNRLITLTALSSAPLESRIKLDFAYDDLGRRISKIVSTWNGSSYTPQITNRFAYADGNLLAILGSDSTLLTSFAWGLDLSATQQGAGGVGGLMSIDAGAKGVHFPAYDGNGNVAGLTKASDGTPSAVYEYGPFGELLRASSVIARANPFRFSTKYQDDETELLYYGYRYLNPTTGVWSQRDPIGERYDANLYRFVYASPLNYIDPDGLTGWALTGPQVYWDANYNKLVQSPEYQKGVQQGADKAVTESGLLIASIFIEPLDWVMTAGEIYNDPTNPWSYAGLLPFVPSAVGKGGKQICKSVGAAKKTAKIDDAAKAVEDFLGGQGKIIKNADGDTILMHGDKKIRFDIKDPHGDKPHFHLEQQTPSGKWKDAGPKHRYYFKEE